MFDRAPGFKYWGIAYMKNLVEFKHITKRFPGVLALNDINLELKAGEVHVLIGENGAGKSTLMKILSGAYRQDEGELLIDGEAVKRNSPIISSSLGIGMIYQELNLIPELSIVKNIFLGSERKKGIFDDREGMYQEAEKYLQMLHLDIDPNTLVKDLGVGTQQMVEIAKAVSKHSKVLVLDEPTSSLTDSEIRELFSIIRMLKEQGVGMCYISHRLEELYEIGDRVTIMRDGAKVGTYRLDEIRMNEMIEKIAGRKIENLYPRNRIPHGECVLEVKNCSGVGFENVSLKVHAGEIAGLSGLVGAGRTELARAIFGIDGYHSGEILLEGKKVKKNSPREAARAGIGLLPEDRKVQGLALKKNIRENMVVSVLNSLFKNGIVDTKKERTVCGKYVEELQIATPTVEKLAGFLSGGTQQKVVIAKWLMADLKLFIFDEPTRGIDVGAKSEIYRLMDDLVHQGAAVLMISSDLPEVLGMSDRIYVMSQGRITGELDHQEADQKLVLRYAYNQGGQADEER